MEVVTMEKKAFDLMMAREEPYDIQPCPNEHVASWS